MHSNVQRNIISIYFSKDLHVNNRDVKMVFVFAFRLFISILLVDALHSFVLGVERRSYVGLGLVCHAHPLQGELAALDEVVVYLV